MTTTVVYLLRLSILCTPNWSIHGLWPEHSEYCHHIPFNYSELTPILSELQSHWKSCYESNKKFWSHEWSKHGTCSNMSEYNYFNKGLSLFYQYRDRCRDGLDTTDECNLCFDKYFTLVSCPSHYKSSPSIYPWMILDGDGYPGRGLGRDQKSRDNRRTLVKPLMLLIAPFDVEH